MDKSAMKDIITLTFKQVRSLFIWQCDRVTFGVPEDWRSHADQVERGEVFFDDCDGFALTCAELLTRRGIPREFIRLAFCRTETGEGHLVCIANELTLDNRQRHTWHWTHLPYEWISSMRMDEIGTWRQSG